MFLAEMSGATFWQGSDTESEVSDDSSENGEEKEDKLKDDGEDPFDEEEENLENPLQTPNAEADSDAPSSRPMENKRLFFEVGLHTMLLLPCKDGIDLFAHRFSQDLWLACREIVLGNPGKYPVPFCASTSKSHNPYFQYCQTLKVAVMLIKVENGLNTILDHISVDDRHFYQEAST